jgi:hypothetical protein
MDGFLPSRTITLPSEHVAALAGSDPAASGGQRRLNESASTSPVERYSSEGDTRVRIDVRGIGVGEMFWRSVQDTWWGGGLTLLPLPSVL